MDFDRDLVSVQEVRNLVAGAKAAQEVYRTYSQEQVDDIMTLKKIDLFEYDLCQNQYLKEDMDRYGRKIY